MADPAREGQSLSDIHIAQTIILSDLQEGRSENCDVLLAVEATEEPVNVIDASLIKLPNLDTIADTKHGGLRKLEIKDRGCMDQDMFVGDMSHGVQKWSKCGWLFTNAKPSAKQRMRHGSLGGQ